MKLLRSTLGICLIALVAWGAAGCGSDDERPSGDVIAARHDDQLRGGDKAGLLIPTGALRVFTGEPVTSLDPDQTRERRAFDAPVGSAYVPMAWRLNTRRFGQVEEYLDTTAVPVVDLVADGESYRLPPPTGGEGIRSFYVQVDGEAEDVRLRVAFDGVTQTIDLRTGKRKAGLASALYDLPRDLGAETTGCDQSAEFEMARAGAEYTCNLTGPMVLPYAAGEWAPKGSSWLVVGLRTSLARIAQSAGPGEGGVWWAADGVTTTLRAGGEEPSSLRRLRNTDDSCPQASTQACGWAAVATFPFTDDPPGSLRVEHTYELVRGTTWGGHSPKERRKVTATGSIDLDTD